MLRKTFVAIAVCGLATIGALRFAPPLTAVVGRQIERYFGWNEAARRADPIGFVNHVSQRLQEDLQKMRRARRTLHAELATLAQEEQSIAARRAFAEEQAADFRQAFHASEFPVALCDAVYPDRDSVRLQVSQLLAEIDGYDCTLAALKELAGEANAKLRKLTVQISSTASQLEMIGVKRELLAVRELSESGRQMLAGVDALLDDNEAVSGNPVRGVEELLQAASRRDGDPVSESRLRNFLAEGRRTDCPVHPKPNVAAIYQQHRHGS